MNINQAKQIPLRLLIESLGGKFSHQRKDGEAWYYSPFRPDERTASFKVNIVRNTWKDFGSGDGGSTIDLWLDCHNADRKNSHAVSDALKALSRFSNTANIQSFRSNKSAFAKSIKPIKHESRFQLVKEPTRISHHSLKQEIARRRLSLDTVSPYIKQAHIRDNKTKKTFYGFAFRNDLDGWEISVPNSYKKESFKTCIGSKAPTFIEGEDKNKIDIFEGFWDFLTWLQMNKRATPNHTAIIMNSLSFQTQIVTKIIDNKKEIESVFLFLDNDEAGEKESQNIFSLMEEQDLTIGTMNHVYVDSKDVNDQWIRDCFPNSATL